MASKKREIIEYLYEPEFNRAKEKVVGKSHNDKGIGTLSEKTVHAVLKNFYEPDEDNHEVYVNGYYADILNRDGIIEIQTRQLNKLRDKLTVFLNEYKVKVVYPMPFDKYISWIDPESGDISEKRKSPRHFSIYDAMVELYKIKSFLLNPNLSITIIMLDMEEYKLLNGWSRDRKRGSVRHDRIPIGIRKVYELDCPEDYMQFIPETIDNGFTSADFAKAAGISRELASTVLMMLNHLSQVKRVGKKGNSFVYDIEERY